jgi:hypothetical protein
MRFRATLYPYSGPLTFGCSCGVLGLRRRRRTGHSNAYREPGKCWPFRVQVPCVIERDPVVKEVLRDPAESLVHRRTSFGKKLGVVRGEALHALPPGQSGVEGAALITLSATIASRVFYSHVVVLMRTTWALWSG